MAKKSKYIDSITLRKMLKPKAEEILKDIEKITESAINQFYAYSTRLDSSFHYDSHTPYMDYERTNSFENFATKGKLIASKDGWIVDFKYRSSDVTVNPWIYGPGSNEWAFDADFLHGFHGGPRNAGGGIWTWQEVPQMVPSPWDVICNEVMRKYDRK